MSSDDDLEKLFFNGISYKELYKLVDPKISKDYFIIKREKMFILKGKRKDKESYLFFHKPISVEFQNININEEFKEVKVNNIYSSIQLEDYFDKYAISNAEIVFGNIKKLYSEVKINIDNFIENENLIIYNNTISYAKYSYDGNILDADTFKPENLSKYFYDYILYTSKNDTFEYDYTENRKKLYSFLEKLLCSNELNFFKFCGPTSTGKSTTLLKFSRKYNNIIYLNLKVIYHLELDNKTFDCYNLIIYEFGRLEFEDDNEKEKFQDFLNKNCKSKPSMFIINEILNYIKDQDCIIIFDQFKIKYISKTYFNKIEELIKISSLKLILCSSINEKDIRDEVIKTINTFRGNITELNSFTQGYYFYFAENFFKREISNNVELDDLFQLFDYKPKFKYLILNCENTHNEIEEIKSNIKDKIKNFFKYEKDLDLCKILLNIKNKINIKYEYSQFLNIIEKVPMKYYILIFEKEYFKINYIFEFMKVLERENITPKECTNYFQQKKYLLDKSFDGKVKGEFFEMSAKFFIKNKSVLPMVIDVTINVKDKVGMKIIENKDDKFEKIIHNIQKDNPKIIKKSNQNKEKEIKLVKKLLKENDIDNKEKLDIKYSNKKNINYYLINQALNYREKKMKDFENKKMEENKRKDNYEEEDNEMEDEIYIEEDEEKGENEDTKNNKEIEGDKEKGEDKDKNLREKERKKGNKKESENNNENDKINKNEKSKPFLNKKRKRGKKEDFYIDNIGKKNILINQEDANGKTLDQAFIFGEEDNKIFLGLQMKYLSNKIEHSTLLKSINKEEIKGDCQNILLRCKLDLNVQIKEWHYILVAYYNKKDKDNIYCKQLEKHCKCNDLEIVYFDPEEQKLYDKDFKKIKFINISNKSNLDYDFPESNPYNMVYNEETNDLINIYYNQRIKKLNMEDYYEQENIDNSFINWVKDTNIKKDEIEKSLKELCQVKKILLIDKYELNNNFTVPSPNKGYIFLFKNKIRNNFICYYHKEGLKAFNLEDNKAIKILELPIYIGSKEKDFFIFRFCK